MSESMALAVSAPVSIPSTNIVPGYLTNLTSSNDAGIPIRSVSSPGGTSRSVPEGQQFGRYQHTGASQSLNATALKSKTPSTMSLEAIAALLSSSPEDNGLDSSPPARSKGFFSMRPKESQFRKSQSFPLFRPTQSPASSHLKPRPPMRKARSVKFADTEGLPLASIRNLTAADPFETEGEIVPKLLSDLGALSLSRGLSLPLSNQSSEKLVPKAVTRTLHFNQPGSQPDFFNKLRHQSVSLESVSTSQPRAIHGIVRVMNIAFDKEVSVRWTHDKWRTHHESKCLYCQGSSDGGTDRFSFTLPANGDDVQFAVCYKVLGMEYWDNNNGHNYLISVER